MPQISYLTKCLQDTGTLLSKIDETTAQTHLSAFEQYVYAMQAHLKGMPQKATAPATGAGTTTPAPTTGTAPATGTTAPAPATGGSATPAPAPTTGASAAPAGRSLSLLTPFKSGYVTPDAMGCVTYPDTVMKVSDKVVFSGTYGGSFKNIMVSVPGTQSWGAASQDGKGGWSVTMDLTKVRTGPVNCRVMAWYDDPTEKQVNLDFTLLIDNPAMVRAAPPAPSQAAGMKLLLSDDFDALPSDDRWAFGVRPDGSQWGSDAYFVPKTGNLAEVLQLPMPSALRIRAVYDPAFEDPQKWSRKWRSGLLCTAYDDGRKPLAAFRKGYVEMRAILPLGKGMWPSMWACQLADGVKGIKAAPMTEIDPLEGYCQLPDPGKYYLSSGAIEWVDAGKTGQVDGPRFKEGFDATSDWHVYGAAIDDTTMKVYVDGALTQTVKLPASTSKDPFFWMFDNAIGGGWPVGIPPAKFLDMWIDYIRIYSAD